MTTSDTPSGERFTPGWLSAEELNANGGALTQRMGIHFTHASLERAVATMPVEGNTQPYGILHGGATVVLAETVGSMLAVLAAGEGRAAVGMSVNATHHRPVTTGSVTATGTPLSVARTAAAILIEVEDDEGRRVATVTLLCQLRDAPPRRD